MCLILQMTLSFKNTINMKTHLLKKSDFAHSSWAGGETTQLFIYPYESDFKSRKFDFRISTATVKIEESDFTSLSGFSRKLMVLDGEILLKHKNHHIVKLKKFEVDNFEGSWETKCIGTCEDFNIITKSGIASELYHLNVCNNELIKLKYNNKTSFISIYVFKGSIELNISNISQKIEEGNLLLIENVNKEKITISGKSESDIIISEIIYPS